MFEGTQIGNYRLQKRIGEGGMGAVWLAEHIVLGRRAAVKLLHPEFSGRSDIVTRFFNEARAATAIADPGIVQIFDFGQHADGRGYIVMELLDGEPLDRRLAREGALDPREGLRLMRQVASTLGAAHRCGIVHRDLKPENIFIVRDPEVPGGERPKVLDFGIAKLLGDRIGAKTQTAAVMGTPGFMSPEQCRGAGQVDQRSDVYALGCVLFTLMTGRPPFDAEGVGDIIAMHLREPAPLPSQLRPGLSPEIDRLVMRCLAKDPAQRFPTASELATAIDELLGISLQSSAARTVPYSAAAATTLSAAIRSDSTPPAQRSHFGWTVAITGLAAAGVAIGWFTARASGRTVAIQVPPSAERPAPPRPAPAPLALPPAPVEPEAQVAPTMRDALTRFIAWSRTHAGWPCPDTAALGALSDPWAHSLVITCTDQPGDQIAGAISAGPDGKLGTTDDIASWHLGSDTIDLVRGTRWVVAPRKPARSVTSTKPAEAAPPEPATTPASSVISTKPAEAAPPEPATTPASSVISTKPAEAAPPEPAEAAPAGHSEVPSSTPTPAVKFDDNGIPIVR